jgi:hypothetical protein
VKEYALHDRFWALGTRIPAKGAHPPAGSGRLLAPGSRASALAETPGAWKRRGRMGGLRRGESTSSTV